jgi:hypothetical protein
VARIRRPCCCSLRFGVALMRRTRVGTSGGQGQGGHGKHQSAGKISLKPQLGNLGSTGCTDLFFSFLLSSCTSAAVWSGKWPAGVNKPR